MESYFHPFLALILLVHIVKYSASFEPKPDCPSDCICYPDYLSNLESWKWIEKDIQFNPEDPEHEEFNPYIEHNEVYDNPNVARNLREEPLGIVTCILRNDSSRHLLHTFDKIPIGTQVLSLLQGAGSGHIVLKKEHFENLHFLIGIEVQGYTTQDGNTGQGDNKIRLEADAFSQQNELAYLSLENVEIQHRIINIQHKEYVSKIVKVTRISSVYNETFDGNDEGMNELESQLMFMSPSQKKDDSILVPYSEYKKEVAKKPRNHPMPVEPKVAVAFTNVASLIHLRISNCKMEDMSWDMFLKLQNLKYLLLEKNDLLFLPDFVFYSTSNLTALSLSGNRILSLETVGLAGLLHLQKLDMTNNNITHLSELSLPPFPRLEVADFRFNPIETIFPNTFEVMNTTKTLFLGSPGISLTFFPNSFFGLVALTRLEITNVRIGFLEKPMLKGFPNLQHLMMNGNIKRISYDAFGEVPKLEKLILKQCAIQKISMDAFYGLSSLVEVDLSHNKLTYLSPGIFVDQVSLREIYLQFNYLTTLGRHLFDNVPAKLIRLEGNPWHCSCEMSSWNSHVVNQVKRYYIPRPNSTFCQFEYDKGSMCNQNKEYVGFKVKYIYERRVSPVCDTPIKFRKRSVFEVNRKELRHCGTPTTTLQPELLKTKRKPEKTVKPQKMKKLNIKKQVAQIAEQMVKNQEERLVNNPSKIKKSTETENPRTLPVNIPKDVDDEANIISIIQEHLNLPFSQTNLNARALEQTTMTPIIPTDSTYVGETPARVTEKATTEVSELITNVLNTSLVFETETNVGPTWVSPISSTHLPTDMDSNLFPNQILMPDDSTPTTNRVTQVRKVKPRLRQSKHLHLNNPNNSMPPFSKKALKLARLEKMDMLAKRKP